MNVGPLLLALEEAGYLCAFDREVKFIEDACKAELGLAEGGPLLVMNPPKPGEEVPEQESPAWFAKEILAAGKRVRGHIAVGDASKAAAEAVTIGELVAELDAQYDSSVAKAWRELRRKRDAQLRHLSEIGEKGGGRRAAAADELRCNVEAAANEYRVKHAHDPKTRSTRRMARDIASDLKANPDTVRGHLIRLEIR